MKNSLVLLFTLIILVISAISCSNRQEVSESSVARIIKTLSADDMKGRKSLRPEIEKAADFIVNQFRQIGLTPVYDDYRQDFTLYSIQPSHSSVNINGNNIEDHLYFSVTHTDSLILTLQDVSLKRIDNSDDFRDAFIEFRNDNESSIIAIGEEHIDWFNRYRSYFNRANRTLDFDQKPNDLFIISDEPINSANIKIVNDVRSFELENIVGMIPGKIEDEIVLFSAHYDHIGIVKPVEGDSVVNGANDNASGVAGVIELARYFL